jgi:putative ABC transport system permease protein
MMLVLHLRAAARSLAWRPALTAVMVLVLGVGVGIFMVARVGAEAEERIAQPSYHGVYRLLTSDGADLDGREDPAFVWRHIDQILLRREQADALRLRGGEVVATFRTSLPARAGDAAAAPVRVRVTTRPLFEVFARRFVAGGSWPARADDDAQVREAVITEALARRWFGRAGALGRSLDLDGETFSIVGVVADDPLQPYDLRFSPESDELFVPWVQGAALALEADLALPSGGFVNVSAAGDVTRLREVARLVPCAEFWRLARQRDPGVLINSLLALVALGGCTFNFARLLMAKLLVHSAPTSIRRTLGARRIDIFVLQLLEAWWLAAPAALVSLAIAIGCTALMNALVTHRPADYRFDAGLLLVDLGVTYAAALVAGFWPAVQASRVKPATQLGSV